MQSLQHVDIHADGQNYPVLEQTLDDTSRILKKDGLLILSNGLPSTLRESVWFLHLQSQIKEKLAKRQMSVDKIMDVFPNHGFRCVVGLNLLTIGGSNIYPRYLDQESPLSIEWRKATSMFEVASDQEIKVMEKTLLEMKQKGTLKQFIKENDHTSERGLICIFAFLSKVSDV